MGELWKQQELKTSTLKVILAKLDPSRNKKKKDCSSFALFHISTLVAVHPSYM